jgi:catechol 2,3-dioxygenase-like lactoylglutathione lyase family enzyme
MHVNHVNVVVADMERSLAFYVGLLGMRVTFETHLTGDWIDEVSRRAAGRALSSWSIRLRRASPLTETRSPIRMVCAMSRWKWTI